MIELYNNGGLVMICIAAASLVAWYLSLSCWLSAGSIIRKSQTISLPLLRETSAACPEKDHADDGTPPTMPAWEFQIFRFRIDSETSRLRRSLWLIGTLASVLLLLGLLGTVLGMLISFEVIQTHGTSQPRLLAAGIGRALVTTQAGLCTALPVLFFHHIIGSRLRLLANEIDVLSHIARQPESGLTTTAKKLGPGRLNSFGDN